MHAMAIEDLLHPYLGKYLESPGWLKASAGRAYSMLPTGVRLGRAYGRFRGQGAAPARASPATRPVTLDVADEAAESFALCREHCTRPLMREAARHLRAVYATQVRERRLRAAKAHAAHLADQLQEGIELRVAADEQHVRMMAWAPRLYVDPQRAIQEIRRRHRVHDRKRGDFWLMYYFKWKRFGRPRRTWQKGWRGWLGFADHKAEEHLVLHFRTELQSWIDLLERQPGPEWMPEAQAAAAEKGVEYLLEALPLVRRVHPDARVVVDPRADRTANFRVSDAASRAD